MSATRLCLLAVGIGALAAALLSGSASGRGTGRAAGKTTTTASSSATAPAGRTTATAKHVFAAFDSSGAPPAGVGAHRSGYCFAASITVSARTAYRCLTGTQLLDPCFVNPGATVAACYASPWNSALALTLTKPLPSVRGTVTITQPWALVLAGGQRCVVTTGTALVLQRVAMRYQCLSGTAGLLATRGPWLRALYQGADGAVSRVRVRAKWTT